MGEEAVLIAKEPLYLLSSFWLHLQTYQDFSRTNTCVTSALAWWTAIFCSPLSQLVRHFLSGPILERLIVIHRLYDA